MNDSVLVVGSVAFDDVETPFGKRENALGGSAVFFSMAASHFTSPRMVGVAGKDFPEEALTMLRQHKIDIRGLEIVEGKTFRWGGVYHENINQRDTLYTDLNVFADFKPVIPREYRQTPFLFLGNIQPSLQLEVLDQIKDPKYIALDTMNLWINTKLDDLLNVIRKVDLLIINDSELTLLTKETNLLAGLEKLHEMGPQHIIIKKGEHGAFLSYNTELFYSPAFPVKQASDPTGAGDSFAGGLMGYLTTCKEIDFTTLKKALVYGCVMGSFVVEKFSTDGLTQLDQKQIELRFNALRTLVTI
ncbi:MAG: PfkB family carbohydrate kinase [Candidatus Marinimicrobia bacterium]|nr:PfkB family carbohydrate kinase [Candidatus Neomarinimicrobiota bacterium]